MALKKDIALRILEAIKHILKQTPQEGRLLAYTSLCCHIPTGLRWHCVEPSNSQRRHRAVRFIARLRGQESVTEACSKLCLPPLKQRRRNHKERHLTILSAACDKITGAHQKVTMTTRSAAHGEMTSVYATLHVYHPPTMVASYQEPSEIPGGNKHQRTEHRRNILKIEEYT